MTPGSQNERILGHLRRGRTLTPLSAIRLFDCLRLGGRIHELRTLGFDIRTEKLELSSGKRIARYSLGQKKAPEVVL
jgi:hypothetical protein